MADVQYPCYRQKKDKSGNWYWIYYAKNGEEIARSSESYVDRANCKHSIDLLQKSGNDKVYYEKE